MAKLNSSTKTLKDTTDMRITKELIENGKGLDMTFTVRTVTTGEGYGNYNKEETIYHFSNYIDIEEVEFRRYIADLHERALGIDEEYNKRIDDMIEPYKSDAEKIKDMFGGLKDRGI